MTFLKSPTSHYSKMISWAHDGEAMSPPVACHSVFAGFTVYRSPINSPLSFYIGFLPFASCWELDLAKPRDLREAASLRGPVRFGPRAALGGARRVPIWVCVSIFLWRGCLPLGATCHTTHTKLGHWICALAPRFAVVVPGPARRRR